MSKMEKGDSKCIDRLHECGYCKHGCKIGEFDGTSIYACLLKNDSYVKEQNEIMKGVNILKVATVLKILKRYEKGLANMHRDALANGTNADAEHYKLDRTALLTAIEIIERSNTES